MDMRAAIDVQAEAFALLASGRAVAGLRTFVSSQAPPAVAIFNPCFIRDGGGYGIKVISDFYGNEARGLTRMTGLVALFDGETGYPRTVMDAGYLTDLRTGAGTALAARFLARADSRVMTIIGAGRVARSQVAALTQLFEIDTVHVVTRSRGRGEELARRMRDLYGTRAKTVHMADRAASVVPVSDIVVTATTSETPVLFGEWLKPGTFVAAVGAHKASAREVDSETIRRASKLVIDSRADCLDHAGDLIVPLADGLITRDVIADMAELAAGRGRGRSSDEEITFYKSIGVPVQDLVTAQHIERAAIARGVGIEVELGGED